MRVYIHKETEGVKLVVVQPSRSAQMAPVQVSAGTKEELRQRVGDLVTEVDGVERPKPEEAPA